MKNRKNVWAHKSDDDGDFSYVVNIDGIASDILVSSSEDKDFVWETEEEENGKKVERKIKIEEDNGVKKLTITTTVDGEEKTETYEGAQADDLTVIMH